jgi:hypothetical protein
VSTPAFPPVGNPSAPGPPRVQPYHLQEHQRFAVDQERQRHADALWHVGEYAVFWLMWHLLDFEQGLVTRCSRCWGTSGTDARIAAVYEQPKQNECPVCFGTTFEGGYRARIVRPAIFADTDQSERLDKRGEVHPHTVSIETTWDFRIRQGDYVGRADNSRWRMRVPSRTTLRSGFGFAGQTEASLTYARIIGEREEEKTVAYKLPPEDPEVIRNVLSQPARSPLDFEVFEQLRGPLIPDSYLGA